jgi:hypothetical protein
MTPRAEGHDHAVKTSISIFLSDSMQRKETGEERIPNFPDFSRLGALLPGGVRRCLHIGDADCTQGAVKEAGEGHQRGCARGRTSELSPKPFRAHLQYLFSQQNTVNE